MSEITAKLAIELNKKLEDLVIEGLKRKGFEPENRSDLESFLKHNCRCEERSDLKQKTYFVNDIPFFLHCYEIEKPTITRTDREFKISINQGYYSFI